MTWANVANALIGVWFIIAPFALAFTGKAEETWTSIIGGLILLVLAGAAALSKETRQRTWVQYVNGVVGIWFIIAPFVLEFTMRPLHLWTSVIGGLIAAVLSGWLAFGAPKAAVSH